MIKLLLFLFAFTSIYSQETVFKFPDHHGRFIHTMERSFKKSSDILIISPSYNHAALKKGVLSVLKRGGHVKLIVQDPKGDPLSLVQYERFDLFITLSTLSQTIILIDERLVCASHQAVDEDSFALEPSYMRCSDTPHEIKAIRRHLKEILKHSKAYLE